jgi:hypothetical protein
MAVTVDSVRRFAGADPEGDEEVLGLCLSAAIEWYEQAGVRQMDGSALYDFWVANLAAWMYDNRGNADMMAAIPPYIVSSVHQLRRG